jgi:hypothetical protein
MKHKEYYIWLEGYLYGKLENENINIGPIIEKMSEVKDEPQESVKITPFERIAVPVNPFPKNDDPYRPFEVYCENKNVNTISKSEEYNNELRK